EMCPPDTQKVLEIFDELEFRRLKENFLNAFSIEGMASVGTSRVTPETDTASETKAKPAKSNPAGEGQFSLFGNDGDVSAEIKSYSSRATIENTEHFYQTVQPGMGSKLFLQNLMKQISVCFDTETTSLNPLEAELVGIAFSWEKGKGFYIPFPENREEAQLLLEELRTFFENESIQKIGQNLKYDIKVLAKYNISVKGKLFDTMLAHYLINPDMRHNMDVLSETYLNYTPVSITELIGKKGKNQLNMRDVEIE